MKILHHGYTYPNYCKCRNCDCEFVYEDTETVSVLDNDGFDYNVVYTYIQCPECKNCNTLYNYQGKIDKVRKYSYYSDKYQKIDFDENTMERR